LPERLTRPRADEAEFTAFGPGYGECLVIHLGENEWAVVDSCISPDGRHPALDYLVAMGVEVASAVKLVVATHWHDDHVRGMARLMAACTGARFVCSVALRDDELLHGIKALRREQFPSARITSGVEEMMRTISQLRPGTATWAIEGGLLYQRHTDPACRVVALSPSHQVQDLALQQIRGLVLDDPARRVPRPDRNLGAVALWVEVGDLRMLLGADLQETASAHRGWTTVVESQLRPPGLADVFKVPHHGSENGHHDPVWRDMLVPNPEVVVCPYSNGKTDLPTDDDVRRLCGLGRVHLTAPTRAELTRRSGRLRRQKIGDSGRVTLRRAAARGTAWTVEHDGASYCPSVGTRPTD
jgi:beta-lactamase superfamily II metal-dependent hydrolase